MSRTDNPEALGLEQRCVRPGHWIIEGYDVRAGYLGRSRRINHWYIVDPPEGAPPSFLYLSDVREWIKDNR